MKKLLIKLLPVVIMIAIVVMPTVLAASGTTEGPILVDESIGSGEGSTFTKNAVSRLWDVVRTVLQIAAVGALIFSGVKYMFASADAKADIKKSIGILVVGALLVFGSTIIVDIIIKVTKDIANVT